MGWLCVAELSIDVEELGLIFGWHCVVELGAEVRLLFDELDGMVSATPRI